MLRDFGERPVDARRLDEMGLRAVPWGAWDWKLVHPTEERAILELLQLAERHAHAWFKHLEPEKLDLGSGKRMLVPGGKLHPKYLVTLPADLDAHARIKRSLEGVAPGYAARIAKREQGRAYGMLVSDGEAEIKEVSPVLRGSVYPESDRRIVARAEAEFGFAEVPVLSFEDLYAGKIL